MTLLPRIRFIEWTSCERDGEAEGWSFCLSWFALRIEISAGTFCLVGERQP